MEIQITKSVFHKTISNELVTDDGRLFEMLKSQPLLEFIIMNKMSENAMMIMENDVVLHYLKYLEDEPSLSILCQEKWFRNLLIERDADSLLRPLYAQIEHGSKSRPFPRKLLHGVPYSFEKIYLKK